MKRNILILLYGSASLILMTGVILTITTISQMPIANQKLQKRVDAFQQLCNLEKTVNRQQAAVRVFEGLTNDFPVSLTALATSCVTNATAEIRMRNTRDMSDGWILKEVEIIFNDVNVNHALSFLNAAEFSQPPWRLTECHISATRSENSYGRVVLIMEALSK